MMKKTNSVQTAVSVAAGSYATQTSDMRPASIQTHSLCEDVDSAPHPADRGKCNECRRGDHVTAKEEMR
jgi:uncharacterized low-complexity protein